MSSMAPEIRTNLCWVSEGEDWEFSLFSDYMEWSTVLEFAVTARSCMLYILLHVHSLPNKLKC